MVVYHTNRCSNNAPQQLYGTILYIFPRFSRSKINVMSVHKLFSIFFYLGKKENKSLSKNTEHIAYKVENNYINI